MKSKKNLCFVFMFVILFIFTGSLSIYAAGKGTSGAAFLKIGRGVRAIGMGGAFCAVADDASTIYWNPAGLTNTSDKEIVAAYTRWFADITQVFLGYVHPLSEKNALGAGLLYLGATDTKRDEWGEDMGSFGITEMAPTIGYAHKFGNGISIGGSVKYIYQKLEDEVAGGFAFDIGGLYKTSIENLTLGVSIQNIGAEIKFIGEGDALPRNIKLGIAYKGSYSESISHSTQNFTLALDTNLPSDGEMYVCIGGEYWVANIIALRVGYRTGPADEGSGVTAGAGLRIERILLDYAFVPYGDLGNTHRISLGMKF